MTTRTNLTLQQNFIELHWSERNWKLENHACRIVMHFWGRVNLRRRDKIKIKKKNNLLKAMWDTTENFILLAIGRDCSIYMSSHEKTTTRYNRQTVSRPCRLAITHPFSDQVKCIETDSQWNWDAYQNASMNGLHVCLHLHM